ncbi:MAG: hypothetical protein ACR2OW_12135 [Methyloligellaceae bacterium]
MSLEEKLAALREGSAKKIPEDKRAIIGGFVQSLRDSGQMERAIGVGQSLPAFSLKNQDDAEVSSASILANGPMVLTVFRGHW